MAQDWFDVNAPETPQRGPAPGSPAATGGTITGYNADGYPIYSWQPGQGPVVRPGQTVADANTANTAAGRATVPTGAAPAGDPVSQFQQYLARHPNDPQAAIDEWNAAGDPGGLKPMWQASSKTIGISGNQYLVMPGTGDNHGTDWQAVKRPAAEGAGGNGSFSFPSWNENFSYAPWDKTFKAPDGLTEQNDPGYKDRMALGADAIQRSALAQGTGLTGGTLKDLEQFGQTFGSTEYGNVYGRALNDYNTALDAYKLNYNTAAQQYNQRYAQYGDSYNKAYQTYMGNFGVSNTLNQENWANYMGLASLGLSGAGQTNTAGGQYSAGASGTITGIGNAGAAGIVGGANATNSGLAGITNIATQTPYLYGTQSSYRRGVPGLPGGAQGPF